MLADMAAIFISYRRSDTAGATGRLADALATRFGSHEVFRDVDAIEAGVDFRVALDRALNSARVVLVVIGRSWLSSQSEWTELEPPEDYVRLEIDEALERNVLLIPVLVEGVEMPGPEDVPPSIRALVYRQGHEMSESRWTYDFERLIELLIRHARMVPVSTAVTRGAAQRLRDHFAVSAMARAPGDFLRLLYEPRRFLAGRGAAAESELVRAFVFVLLSQVVAGTLVVQEWPTQSFLLQFILAPPLLALLVAGVVSVPLYQAWRVCGARREYRRVLIILLYQVGFVGLGLAVAMLVVLIGMNMMMPDAVHELAENPTAQGASVFFGRLQSHPNRAPWQIASLLSGFIFVGLLVWGFATWGAIVKPSISRGRAPGRRWRSSYCSASFRLQYSPGWRRSSRHRQQDLLPSRSWTFFVTKDVGEVRSSSSAHAAGQGGQAGKFMPLVNQVRQPL